MQLIILFRGVNADISSDQRRCKYETSQIVRMSGREAPGAALDPAARHAMLCRTILVPDQHFASSV